MVTRIALQSDRAAGIYENALTREEAAARICIAGRKRTGPSGRFGIPVCNRPVVHPGYLLTLIQKSWPDAVVDWQEIQFPLRGIIIKHLVVIGPDFVPLLQNVGNIRQVIVLVRLRNIIVLREHRPDIYCRTARAQTVVEKSARGRGRIGPLRDHVVDAYLARHACDHRLM